MKTKLFTVSVEYNLGDLQLDFDVKLNGIAKAYGGDKLGSGYFIPTRCRDISYAFRSVKNASAFQKRLVTFDGVRCVIN